MKSHPPLLPCLSAPPLFFATMICFSPVNAQIPSGIYSFHKHELAASFNFKPGNTFEFFYSYGASDRTATGTFSMSGDTVKLRSTKEPGKDFTIRKQSKEGKKCKVVAKDPNTYLLKNLFAVATVNGEQKFFESDENGIIDFGAYCEKIYLQHTLFPDAMCVIKDDDNENTYFEVTLNPSLAQVSFLGIDLIVDGDELIMPTNYFMAMENIRFAKEY